MRGRKCRVRRSCRLGRTAPGEPHCRPTRSASRPGNRRAIFRAEVRRGPFGCLKLPYCRSSPRSLTVVASTGWRQFRNVPKGSGWHRTLGLTNGGEQLMARIAVGGFQHETNTFAPQRATWDDFERADAWPGFVRGAVLIDAVHGYNIPIAGAVEALRAKGHELVPLCWCSAPPSSYVERDAYERVAGGMLEDLAAQGAAKRLIDGIYLDLHGAMVAEHLEDGEGELLRRIRALVGEQVPIVASLDYHTNMTAQMVRHASLMVGYRTYPHIDMAATGGRAALLLDRLLIERRPLYKAYRQLGFLIPLVWQCTGAEPARGIFALIDEVERGGSSRSPGASHNQGILSITHTPGFPPADIAQCGPALVVYGHDREAAEAAADRLAAAIHAREAAFAGKLYTPEEAVAEALLLARHATKPIVLADIQDNPGAGGTSDTVGLLRALIAQRARGAVIGMIVDPEAAAV